MNYIISLLLSTRIMTLFTGSLAGGASAPHFLPPRIVVAQSQVKMDCVLANAYSDQMKKLAETGTPILVYLFVDCRDAKSNATIKQVVVESSLSYDIINKQYCVVQTGMADTLRFDSLEQAAAMSTRFERVPLLELAQVEKAKAYVLETYAILGKAKVEALEGKSIDLMYYWDYKRPSFRTEAIHAQQLLPKPKGPSGMLDRKNRNVVNVRFTRYLVQMTRQTQSGKILPRQLESWPIKPVH